MNNFKCHQCGTELMRSAMACRSCGAKTKRPGTAFEKCVLAFAALVFLVPIGFFVYDNMRSAQSAAQEKDAAP